MQKTIGHLLAAVSIIGMGAMITIGFGLTFLSQATAADTPVSFEKQVMPIFVKNCTVCHSPGGLGEITSALDLTNYKELRMGSAGGVALVPFHADRSPMMRYLKDNWDSKNPEALKMPPPPYGGRLSPQDLKVISDWIDQGAKNN
jgi:mono/diheme cytochrome c family protein